jgi:Ca2+/Na+ antiporter
VSNLWTSVVTVVAVFATSALFGWTMFRLAKSAGSLRYRRRRKLLLAAIYVFSMVFAVGQVIRGNQPAWSLLFLPIPLFFVYWLLRTASLSKEPAEVVGRSAKS